ncbi:MAG: type II secretion system GspH family protein [Armatimonadetes bacterium]|nr:type II secretion system GspH family protein [Armatimonadota bacterium]
MRRRLMKRAFTLIELLTVMAISAILLTIIAIPVVQSFNLTRAAQGFADAQNRARILISQIEREITNSAAVRDNSGVGGTLIVRLPNQVGTQVNISLPYTKLDVIKPAAGDPSNFANGAFVDPDTGKADPTLSAPKGQPVLPGAKSDTVVRYFIARRDPFTAYNNPYLQLRLPGGGGQFSLGTGGRDNLYVLMRAEVPMYVVRNIAGIDTRVVNSDFFFDLDRDADPNTTGPLMDDPAFMDPLAWADLGIANALTYALPQAYDPADRTEMVNNWLREASIVTEFSRFDMIQLQYNKQNREVVFTNGLPAVTPLVRFQPTRMNPEAAKGMLAVRTTEETDNSEKIGPETYETQNGGWSDLFMQIWPSAFNPGSGPGDLSSGAVRAPWAGDPTLTLLRDATGDYQIFGVPGQVFNVSLYDRLSKSGAPYPFYNSVNWANLAASPAARNQFMAFAIEPEKGRVRSSFDIREHGVDATIPFEDRVPSTTGAQPGVVVGATVTPTDPTYQSGAGWQTYTGINQRFARLWHEWDTLWPDVSRAPARDDLANGVKRYIDLRNMVQPGGTTVPSPISYGQLGRASIVPGSEVIVGPDQNPGPNYGRLVRYTRVPNVDTVAVGPNQYKINYTDRREPDWNALFGFTGGSYDKSQYNGNDFLSAILQARYRAGYVELNSRFGEPIPGIDVGAAGNIYVTYRFQFTEPNDVVSVDYGSTELMEVVLTIQNYPQSNLPNPQIVTVRGSAAVRNKVR